MNKRIKSLLVAGLLVVGMGFATVDSYAAEVNIPNPKTVNTGYSEPVYAYNENGIKVLIVDISGMPDTNTADPNANRFPDNTYDISVEWDATKVTVNSANVVTIGSAGEISKETKDLTINGNRASLRLHVPIEFGIHAINLDYDMPPADGKVNNPPHIDTSSIYSQYKDNMEALGKLENGVRTIGKDAAISQDAWDDFYTKFNATKNFMKMEKIKENEYGVYISLDNESKGELVETIKIEFFNSEDKGWLPEITPGTGQALTVGGIVIGATAVAGLLVNNRRKKDEE